MLGQFRSRAGNSFVNFLCLCPVFVCRFLLVSKQIVVVWDRQLFGHPSTEVKKSQVVTRMIIIAIINIILIAILNANVIVIAIIFLIIGIMVRMFVQLITIIVTTSSGDVLSEWTKCPPLTLCLH